MSDKETSAILGLKGELKAIRAKARDLAAQNERWSELACTLKTLAGLSDAQYSRLLHAASLPSNE
jgi:hypothetical protein